MHPAIIGLSTVELARLIRQGDLRPSEVIEAHITRIEIVNPQLNAVVSPHFEQARREARAADARLQCGEPVGPLHGVPVTIKDAFDVAGAPATCGLTSRKRHIPETDASAVARLRLAGAIVLGKTNTPDNCWHQETVSALFGRTNNPWDLRRSPGGSTGGEAAIIAASGSPLGLGSDIAGSIRLPAAFCGIVGLRPTSGALDERGFWPPSEGRLGHLNAIGPMARRVEDVTLAYAVLTGHIAQEPDATVLRGRILCSWLDDGLIPSSTAVQAGVQAATAALLDELGQVLGGAAPTVEQLEQLPLLDRVIKESMRVIPVVPGVFRRAAEGVELGGYHVPAHTEIFTSTYFTHHMPELYPEPERFLPSRWETISPSPFEYSPFSVGPRMCIGATFALFEMKIVLPMLLQRYRFELPAGTRVARYGLITISPLGGLTMLAHPQDRQFSRGVGGVHGTVREMVELAAR